VHKSDVWSIKEETGLIEIREETEMKEQVDQRLRRTRQEHAIWVMYPMHHCFRYMVLDLMLIITMRL
jgi:hypothetical protein